MIPRSMAVGVGKGGVGKTALAVNVAANWAAIYDSRVLLVDCDTQASATTALGLAQHGDDGRSLYEAVLNSRPLEVLTRENVRKNSDRVAAEWAIDVVPAGEWTRRLARDLGPIAYSDGAGASEMVSAPFTASGYDVLVFDLPPTGQSPLADAVMAAAQTLLVPIGIQPGDLTGVPTLARQLDEDPSPTAILGVVLNAVPARSTRRLALARQMLAEMVGDGVVVFGAVIPEARAAMAMAFEQGLVISELYNWVAPLKVRQRQALPHSPPSERNVRGLRAALEQLTAEVHDRFMAAVSVPA
ncbi:MAG: ParA family protein [Gemmatimonadetes bacterium]|nr:ParA family protein [Gemmatimonadota bacterium]